MAQHSAINRANTHGHAAFLYETLEERLQLLSQYFQEGLAKNELCVFVTPGLADNVVKNFESIGFAASKPVEQGALRIFEMNSTYLPDGHFAADFMLRNVSNYIDEAKTLGFSGLRTAGEMTWMYDHPEEIDKALGYEDDVNGLGDSSPNFIGLCLYPVEAAFNKVLGGVLRTHPSFIYNGEVHPSPYFGHPEPLLS